MNWQDFKKRQSKLPNTTQVGNEFEQLAKLYLLNDSKYQNILANVWL